MKNKNKIYLTILIIILTLALILINIHNSNEEIIKIGWIGPQTGQSAVLGMDSWVSAQIAVDEINEAGGINGKKVKLIIEDDQYDIARATNSYSKLVNIDGVRIILVNTYGSVFALADRAKEDGVLIMNPLDCNIELANLNENVFCLATSSETVTKVLAEHAKQSGFEKVGILYWNSDLFMPLVQKFFVDNYPGEVILSEAYSAGTSDFKTPLLKMIGEDVEAIVLLGYDETGLAMRQSRTLGFNGQFYTTGTVTSPPIQELSEGHVEGTIFSFWEASKDEEPTKSFTNKFVGKQGRPAILDLASYPTYDATLSILKAIEYGNSQDTKDIVISLIEMPSFEGVTGTISFNEDGSMEIIHSAYRFVDGVPVLVR